MKLFNLFGKKPAEQAPVEKSEDGAELGIYSGMRVEVTAPGGRMLFVAKLLGLQRSCISTRSPPFPKMESPSLSKSGGTATTSGKPSTWRA